MKRLWQFFLTGHYSGAALLNLAVRQFDLRTRRRWRTGGTSVTQGTIYRILRNPFYTGHIVFERRWYPANHEPMITVEEFNRAQRLLRGTRARPRRYRFSYTGLIQCGHCGASVTAHHKTNRYGSRYIYYHCTHAKKAVPCTEGCIEERELERQVIAFFSSQGQNARALVHKEGIRHLVATLVSSVTLQNKKLSIVLKASGFDSQVGLTGESWNQLLQEIKGFASLFDSSEDEEMAA